MDDFSDAVARIRASLSGPDLSPGNVTDEERRARRRAGIAAYERANEARGLQRGQGRIMACAVYGWDENDL